MAKLFVISLLLNLGLAGLIARQRIRAVALRRAAEQAASLSAESLRRLRLAGAELREASVALAGAARGPEAPMLQGISARLLDLAGLLLDHAEPGRAPCRLEEAPVALGPLLDFVLAQVRVQLGGGQRAWRIAPDLGGIRLLADRRALHQVLLRILSGAALATREGDWIEIAPEPHPEGWALAIEDEGLGLAIAGLAARGPESRGIGLGLTLARDLMKAHGGRLALETAQKVGTRALLIFPRERVLEEAA